MKALSLVLLVAVGCGGDDDAPAADAPAADGAAGSDAAPDLPAWDRSLPASEVMGTRRGLEPARGIVHLHSPYSHDACDGEPRAMDGTVDETCLEDLRRALCDTTMDFAALTDHDATMADEPWDERLFLARG